MKTCTILLSIMVLAARTGVAQDFNGTSGLTCRGSQKGNDYCCFDGIFSGPAWNGPSPSSVTMIRKSEISIQGNNKNIHKRDVVTEMASGLTCSGFAAITLTNSDASALLTSATSAADGVEGTGSPTVSVNGASETPSQKQTQTSSATVESASASSKSTNGAAVATKMPNLVLGGAAVVLAYAL